MGKKEEALGNFASGCNCAQAVACAFCDRVGLDRDEAKRISAKYGGGSHGVCGALLGAFAIVNFLEGRRNLDDPAAAAPETEALLKKLEDAFRDRNGSVLCRELRGAPGGPKLRSCTGCVEDAAELLGELLVSLE